MQHSFTVYPKSILPNGFTYPAAYLQLSKNMYSLQNINFLWWFQDSATGAGVRAYELRNKIKGLNLIPLARYGDWAAYFDGDDQTGSPKVYVLDLGNLSNCIELENFDEWLYKASTGTF